MTAKRALTLADGTPASLGDAGRELWHRVTKEFELSPTERSLLGLACEAADDAAGARAAIAKHGVTTTGGRGQIVANPALSVARQAELSVARILGQLGCIDVIEKPARGPSTPGPKPQLRRMTA
jgi:P27 family predicted phage terminase small subunit